MGKQSPIVLPYTHAPVLLLPRGQRAFNERDKTILNKELAQGLHEDKLSLFVIQLTFVLWVIADTFQGIIERSLLLLR